MELPVPIRRLAYRGAYAGLRVYWFLLRPGSRGVKCILTDGERILLVRHTYGSRRWDLPGGAIRRDEAPIATARREMTEELGVPIDDWTPLGELEVDAEHHHDHVHYFGAEVDAPALKLNRGELSTARWFPRADLPPDLGRYARAIIATLPALE